MDVIPYAAGGLANRFFTDPAVLGAAFAAGLKGAKSAYGYYSRGRARASAKAHWRYKGGMKGPSRGYRGKRKIGRRSGRGKRVNASSLSKQVAVLSKKANESLSQLTYRAISAGTLQAGVNSQASVIQALCGVTNLENVLAQAKFYDPSNPGTLITANLSTGGYSRKVTFKSCHLRCDIRNSYQVPVEIRVYSCHVTDDTDYTASQAWSNAVGDSSNLTAITQPYTYPSDSVAKNIWNYKLIKKVELKPGQHTTCSIAEKSFDYDPSVTDNHNLEHQRLFGHGRTMLIVVNSVLAHDSSTAEKGLGPGAVDYMIRKRFLVEYNAGGPPIKYLYYNNGMSSTFTNGAVVGNMVTDNQSFSQA